MGRGRRRTLAVVSAVVVALAIASACGFDGAGTAPAGVDADGGAVAQDGATLDGAHPLLDGAAADGSGDGAIEEASLDGGPDASGPCPKGCTSCTGSTCNIDCAKPPGQCKGTVACPPGVPCRVRCNGMDACKMARIDCSDASACDVECTSAMAPCSMMNIACGSGPCRLLCSGPGNSCGNVVIDALDASALCLECRSDGGAPSCTMIDSTPPAGAGATCTTVCPGGACNTLGNGFTDCTAAATCP